MAVSIDFGVLFVGALAIKGLLFRIYIQASDLLNLPRMLCLIRPQRAHVFFGNSHVCYVWQDLTRLKKLFHHDMSFPA